MPPNHEPEHTIEIYVHSEGVQGPDLVEVPSGGQVADLLSEGERLWLQDGNEPLPADSLLPQAGISRRSHVHRGRCDEVKVRVRHAGAELVGEFSPRGARCPSLPLGGRTQGLQASWGPDPQARASPSRWQ